MPAQRLSRRSAFLLVFAFAIVLLSAWHLVVAPALLRARQIRALTDLELHHRALLAFRESGGRFPAELAHVDPRLSDHRDPWGHPHLYLSDGSMFLLAGLGADGHPDGSNYLAIRSANKAMSCHGFNLDQIVSDRGWHRRCGK